MDYDVRRRAAKELAQARRLVRPLVRALAVSGITMVALLATVTFNRLSTPAERVTFLPLLLLLMVAFTVAGILWLRWFAALYRVARDIGRTRDAPVMAWLGWILPIVVLVVPKRMVDDVWRAGGDRARLPWPVREWWALWFGSHVFQLYGLVLRLLGSRDALWVDGVREGLLALATPFAIATVHALTDRLEERVRAAGAAAPRVAEVPPA